VSAVGEVGLVRVMNPSPSRLSGELGGSRYGSVLMLSVRGVSRETAAKTSCCVKMRAEVSWCAVVVALCVCGSVDALDAGCVTHPFRPPQQTERERYQWGDSCAWNERRPVAERLTTRTSNWHARTCRNAPIFSRSRSLWRCACSDTRLLDTSGLRRAKEGMLAGDHAVCHPNIAVGCRIRVMKRGDGRGVGRRIQADRRGTILPSGGGGVLARRCATHRRDLWWSSRGDGPVLSRAVGLWWRGVRVQG
jgi:hypothetical protein